MLAYTYPLLSLFWTMLLFFGFVVWIWLLIVVFGDIFRSHDIGGFAKALWVLLVIFLPLLGVLIYLIARGGKMQERAAGDARQQQQEFDTYVQEVAGSEPTQRTSWRSWPNSAIRESSPSRSSRPKRRMRWPDDLTLARAPKRAARVKLSVGFLFDVPEGLRPNDWVDCVRPTSGLAIGEREDNQG